jgi:quercetin dioxygenase-like cupin family protein
MVDWDNRRPRIEFTQDCKKLFAGGSPTPRPQTSLPLFASRPPRSLRLPALSSRSAGEGCGECFALILSCYNQANDMSAPNEHELRKQLEAEGFSGTYVWQDAPLGFYPDHTHADVTAHIILDGEMTLTMDGRSQTYRAGDRCDVPAGAVHSARMGAKGCRYLVGEK